MIRIHAQQNRVRLPWRTPILLFEKQGLGFAAKWGGKRANRGVYKWGLIHLFGRMWEDEIQNAVSLMLVISVLCSTIP